MISSKDLIEEEQPTQLSALQADDSNLSMQKVASREKIIKSDIDTASLLGRRIGKGERLPAKPVRFNLLLHQIANRR